MTRKIEIVNADTGYIAKSVDVTKWEPSAISKAMVIYHEQHAPAYEVRLNDGDVLKRLETTCSAS